MYALFLLLALPTVGLSSEATVDATLLAPWTVVPGESVFAVVTQKEGLAARLSHNHLIVARAYSVRLDFDPEDPEGTEFELEARAPDLVIDDPEERGRWEERVGALGLVDGLGAPDGSDRRDIRDTMLSDDQLDGERYPIISARLLRIVTAPRTIGTVEFEYAAEVEVVIHDEAIRREVAVRLAVDGDELSIEAIGEFTFEEFGIEPYSAFLGSVKNKNEFFIYLNLKAIRTNESSHRGTDDR